MRYNLYCGSDPLNWEIIRTDLAVTTFSPPMTWEQTYYWRVDVVDGSEIHAGTLWHFRTGGKATEPVPADGAVDTTMPKVTLAWKPDVFADGFKLYLGNSLPLDATPVYEGGAASFTVEGLLPSTTYYWRVDQYVQGELTIAGDVWSFRTRRNLPRARVPTWMAIVRLVSRICCCLRGNGWRGRAARRISRAATACGLRTLR